MSKIRAARLDARLSLDEVAAALNRTGQWLGLAERGKVPLRPAMERTILLAIARLAAFRKTVDETKRKLLSDLKVAGTGASIR